MSVTEQPRNVHWFEKLEPGDAGEADFTPEKSQNILETLHFDKHLTVTSRWIHELMVILDLNDPTVAFHALRGVLFALRDRLAPELLLRFAARLPAHLRGVLLEGYQPIPDEEKSPDSDNEEVFMERVSNELGRDVVMKPDRVFQAMAIILGRHMPAALLGSIGNELPSGLRHRWEELIGTV